MAKKESAWESGEHAWMENIPLSYYEVGNLELFALSCRSAFLIILFLCSLSDNYCK